MSSASRAPHTLDLDYPRIAGILRKAGYQGWSTGASLASTLGPRVVQLGLRLEF